MQHTATAINRLIILNIVFIVFINCVKAVQKIVELFFNLQKYK